MSEPAPQPEHGHVPVMVAAVLEHLAPQPGDTVLDATLGRGGHGAAIIPCLAPGGRYIGLDLDPANVAYAADRLQPIADEANVTLTLQQANFQDSRAVLDDLGVGRVNGLLADLGFASAQVDDPQRGFSFSHEHADAPLDMRLDPTQVTTAAELVNTLPERELADLIYQAGEEPFSRRIARKIVEARRGKPIQTTRRLSELVRQAYGPRARHSRMHPATRTFMALRIAVNGELAALDRLLEALPALLERGGRAVFISFHSLEDRRVKRALLRYAQADQAERLTRKPLTPDEAERAANPRSRSAKLRALRWLAE
ncbi:MAG: 16S rRNA (cytosine(1402)-N(4))-methyltransferase RsmH [Phycisphaeraceae bacterium]